MKQESNYVVMSSTVLSEIALTDAAFQNIADEFVTLIESEVLVPVRFFESDVMEAYQKLGASTKELQKLKLVLDHPYRLVIKSDVVLSDGTQADWGIALFDVLENNYLEMGIQSETREIIVLDSYYRHNDLMAPETQQMHEQNLMKLMTRIALAVSHYLTKETASFETKTVKWLKSPFATARERQLKQIYRNRQQTIHHWYTVDLAKKSLQSQTPSDNPMAQLAGGNIEVRDAKTGQTVNSATFNTEEARVEAQEMTETVLAQATTEVATEETKATTTSAMEVSMEKPTKKATGKQSRVVKEKKEEVVLEVLEDGTKIVQYERAGYWRTQRNKATGEEKKIWIEPKLMQRRVAAK